jgi:hypothetical protein
VGSEKIMLKRVSMKIDTEIMFPALKVYRERRLELSENDSAQRHCVESEVVDMQDAVRTVELMVRRFEASGLYVGRDAQP